MEATSTSKLPSSQPLPAKRPTIFPRKLSREIRSTASQLFLSRINPSAVVVNPTASSTVPSPTIPSISLDAASANSGYSSSALLMDTFKLGTGITLSRTSTDPDTPSSTHSLRTRNMGSSGTTNAGFTLSAPTSQHTTLLRGVSNASSWTSMDSAVRDAHLAGVENVMQLWQNIFDRTLPLFSDQGIRGSVEEINVLVMKWIKLAPNTQTIQDNLNTLLKTGMTAITSKVSASSNEALANRLAETWIRFYGTVLPLFQGIFLPIRLSFDLTTLNPNTNEMEPVDVRKMALTSFRNYVVWPNRSRLHDVLLKRFSSVEHSIMGTDVIARLTQMLLLLNSLLLNDDKHKAVCDLLCVLRQQVRKGSSITSG
ncbi:hypothetical protein BDV3_001031 [Batrachochytrium dendrobatidis]|uniref:Uncharacterized protein n=1 Tax=Batrachochytrium dendrobatidis (strain JEL423) TaxID=403673 RepID=A0A177W9J9_BATDL|nr:hypothetical protein O5D80_005924 [Batrachochytrium dendrobatidis]KAK5671616.1 hypothetical protein QVD99_001458 [Batrachochytrium dendrobatidis]OAJ36392.1 hypothetical protein BDEG_20572 [Batrachochytrium dendrobatidis JEL423]